MQPTAEPAGPQLIVDASVWIDFLRGARTASALHLRAALHQREAVAVLPVVMQEVLQGADSVERMLAWQGLLGSLPCLKVADPLITAIAAAQLYAHCRWSGSTPRSGNDCLIAVSCIEFDRPLLHRDRDFERIARIAPRLRFAVGTG